MNKRNFRIAGLIIFIPTILVISFFTLKSDAIAWLGCCDPGPGDQFHGYWFDECCYNGGSECCTVGDANASGCSGIIPCEGCCGNGTLDSGEECDGDLGNCGANHHCNNDCECVEDEQECNPDCTTSCPNPPLTDTGTVEIMLADFGGCTDTPPCDSDHHVKDCFEIPSTKPTVSLAINPNPGNFTSLGFHSDTYTGAGDAPDSDVNEPINMVATYTDSTSAEIETLYVWFKQQHTTPITPQFIDLDNSSSGQTRQTHSKSQFGFLMHREGASWVPYIPGIVGDGHSAGDRWLHVRSYGGNSFSIYGPGEVQIVVVKINSVSSSGNSVILNFDLTFNNLSSNVIEGKYYAYLMGNDTFGFTPYDNYDAYPAVAAVIHNLWGPEQIRYYDQWNDSTKSWNVDLTNPDVSSVTAAVVGKTQIRYSWIIQENIAVNNVVGNIYYQPNFKGIKPIDVLSFTGGGSIVPALPINDYNIIESDPDNVIGHLTTGNLFRITGDNRNGSITIDVGDNGQGILDFHITAFDKGGNLGHNQVSFDLRDWMITYGGLLYTNDLDVTVKEFASAPGNWNSKKFLGLNGNINHIHADISTELVGLKTGTNPYAPIKSDDTLGYMIRPYNVTDYPSYYTILKGLFERKREGLNIYPVNIVDHTLNAFPVLPHDPTRIFLVDIDGDLTVSNGFICRGQGIIFVSGNLTIDGRIRNNLIDQDACIFVVGGNILIGEGVTMSVGADMRYDEINAYILGDGTATIAQEGSKQTFDGIYINGGIHSLEGITVARALKLQDRLFYPAFVVDHHSKYGKLARLLFGSQYNLQKTEIGLKPY